MAKNDNLDDLLSQALDAHRVVEAVDFDAVARHEPEAIEQLDKAITSLEVLEQTASPQARHQRTVLDTLERAHLAGRVGHLYQVDLDSGTDGLLPYEDLPHLDGLAPFEVVVAPDYTPVDGLHGLFVTRQGVVSAILARPVEKNRWKVLQTQPFKSPEHMVIVLARLMSESTSTAPGADPEA